MEESTNRRIGSQQGKDGILVGKSFTSPTQDTRRAELVVPPNVVLPIVFVPGIMGSNLRNKQTGESVWNANSVLSLAWQWAFRSAKTRQTKLDPDVVEADPDGKPPEITDYSGDGGEPQHLDEDQLRERGWGTVSKYGYGDFMAWLEPALNAGSRNPWEHLVAAQGAPGAEPTSEGKTLEQSTSTPEGWGAEKAFSSLTSVEAESAWDTLCPLYGAGYNWLQSNGASAKDLAALIKEIIAEWRDKEVAGLKPYRCDQVILVTHSMGGLVARATAHGTYGNSVNDILGICHGVMPADGAAASYHHVRSGYDGFSRFVLGKDGAQVTAIFANSCGPLELLPNKSYGGGWLRAVVRSASGEQELFALPQSDPYLEIYVKREVWWRLVDPALIDPANRSSASKSTGGVASDPWLDMYLPKLVVADQFHADIDMTYPAPTYAHYGSDPGRESYSDIVWETSRPVTLSKKELLESLPEKAHGLAALKLALTPGKDNSDPVRVDQNGTQAIFEIAAPAKPGDDTVPENSGAGPFSRGGQNVRQSFRLAKMSEGHAGSYDDKNVRQITLYSIAKIVSEKGVP